MLRKQHNKHFLVPTTNSAEIHPPRGMLPALAAPETFTLERATSGPPLPPSPSSSRLEWASPPGDYRHPADGSHRGSLLYGCHGVPQSTCRFPATSVELTAGVPPGAVLRCNYGSTLLSEVTCLACGGGFCGGRPIGPTGLSGKTVGGAAPRRHPTAAVRTTSQCRRCRVVGFGAQIPPASKPRAAVGAPPCPGHLPCVEVAVVMSGSPSPRLPCYALSRPVLPTHLEWKWWCPCSVYLSPPTRLGSKWLTPWTRPVPPTLSSCLLVSPLTLRATIRWVLATIEHSLCRFPAQDSTLTRACVVPNESMQWVPII